MEWHQMLNFHLNAPTGVIDRKPEVQLSYENHKKYLNENNIDISDYIMDTVFANDDLFKIKVCPFPYDMSDSDHYLIWFNPKINVYSVWEDIEYVEQIVNKWFTGVKENHYIFFKNNADNRSIDGVPHYHLFIQRKDIAYQKMNKKEFM